MEDYAPILEGRENPPVAAFSRKLSTPLLLTQWSAPISKKTAFIDRDIVSSILEDRGVRPEAWIYKREDEGGLYPSVDDMEFAAKLMRKTEFAELVSKAPGDTSCGAAKREFKLTPIQRLIARFLHPSTPYRGVLLDHGVGVGKTCTAVSIAEMYLDAMPHKTVFILAPQAIADGFRKTIFDADKLVEATKEERELTGERWASPQCTGMTYLRLSGMANHADRAEIQKEVDKWIKQRYHIMGYFKFYNWVQEQLRAETPPHFTVEEREEVKKSVLLKLFADRLLIIDEAHNLRDVGSEAEEEVAPTKISDAAGGKKLTPILQDVIRYAEGMRLVLMTATPMYDTAPEIVLLLNLLLLNDTKRNDTLLDVRTYFESGELTRDAKKLGTFTRVVKRYVSYMRGENPATFPLRLTPPESNSVEFLPPHYPTKPISREAIGDLMGPEDKAIFAKMPLLIQTPAADSPMAVALRASLSARYAEEKSLDLFNLDQAMQIGNIVYPDGSSGQMGFDTHFKEHTKDGITHFQSVGEMVPVDGQTSPKIARIIERVTKAQGTCFVYSRYIKSGVLPLAIAMELAGGCRVLADGTFAPILPQAMVKGRKPAFSYVLLTPNKGYSPNFAGLVEYATTFKNAAEAASGSKVKVIVGSQVSAEGLDFKCIREIHLLDGWYHLNRVEQIEGRGIRYCSHQMLAPELRNCLLYLHAVAIPEFETPDLYAYRVAIRKAQQIGRVSRLLKENAWDCGLNYAANVFEPFRLTATDAHGRDGLRGATVVTDTAHTSICDYMADCGYTCSAPKELGADTKTTHLFDMRHTLAGCADRLIKSMQKETVAHPLSYVLTTFYRDVPPDFAKAGLREILGIRKFRRSESGRGIIGTLILKNGYIVFQPDRVTDTDIPMAYRYGRAMGRLPRTFMLKRPTLFSELAPVPAAKKREVVKRVVEERGDSALVGLKAWIDLLIEKVFVEESVGSLQPPPPFPTTVSALITFQGWRWVFHHFRGVGPGLLTRIAASWWMDNLWTPGQRKSILESIVKKDPKDYTPIERLITESLPKSDLFIGELRGFTVLEDDKIATYCVQDGEVGRCASTLEEYIKKETGEPVDLQDDTRLTYGLMAYKEGTAVFKSMNKETGRPGGAECATSSNLPGKQDTIRNIHAEIRGMGGNAILGLLLDDRKSTEPDEVTKKRQQEAIKERYDPSKKSKGSDGSLDIGHVHGLNLKQICPYTEFLLRWLDLAAPSERAFLSAVEYVRAVEAQEAAKKAAAAAKPKRVRGAGGKK